MAKIYVLKIAAGNYVVKINGAYMADFEDGEWITKIYRTEPEAIRAEEEYRKFNGLKPRDDEDAN